jgi:hypothetical protein
MVYLPGPIAAYRSLSTRIRAAPAASRRYAAEAVFTIAGKEAILITCEACERYEALAHQRARLDGALSAAQSVQVALPGPFSPEHDREVPAYVDGEISAAELYRRTVSRHR